MTGAVAGRGRRRALALFLLVATLVFSGLAVWQVERRSEKLALIARVETRIHAEPVTAPPPADWPAITRASDEYRRIRVTGRYLAFPGTPVKAVTERGPGYWLLAPLETDQGFTVFVNRGFVSALPAASSPAPAGKVTVTGLLRITEPGGGFLRSNDPASGRWYSRDTAALAKAEGLAGVAPYFIDAAAVEPPEPDGPVTGLTVIRFANNHLVYVLTWAALAVMSLALLVRVRRLG
ncbi:MAG: SURF1 family protein [Bosea sp.]|nr:SURF1 family protein [Bosea sp. (in: a-proteobacteria)]